VCLYAATKQAFEDIIRFYVEAHGVRSITLKLFDTYGKGDHRPKLMNILRDASNQGTELQMSPGDQMIDMVYVDDVARAFIKAAELVCQKQSGCFEEYQVSSGRPMRLKDLVAVYNKVTSGRLKVEFGGRPYREREVMELWGKGKNIPDWRPLIMLEDGIRMIHE
jgi:nucleoside-diphosphate-sugar epimerase